MRRIFSIVAVCFIGSSSFLYAQTGTLLTSTYLRMKMPTGSLKTMNADSIRSITARMDSFIVFKDYNLVKAPAETFYIRNYDSLKALLDRSRWTINKLQGSDFYSLKKDSVAYLAMITTNNMQTMVSMKPFSITSSANPFVQSNKIVATDRKRYEQFGQSVSISNNFAVVGVPLQDEDAKGANTMNDAGAAYIYEKGTDGKWKQVQKLVASDRTEGDNFGSSVAISGNYVVVGSIYSRMDPAGRNESVAEGSVYVFERHSDGNWIQKQKLAASSRDGHNYFGKSVAIEGNTIVVGTPGQGKDSSDRPETNINAAGAVFVFEKTGNDWRRVHKLVARDRNIGDELGHSVAISGNYIIAGAWGVDLDEDSANWMETAGAAYVFEKRSDGKWVQAKKLVANDRSAYSEFGFSVSISGDNAIIGARNANVIAGQDSIRAGHDSLVHAGKAYIFSRSTGGSWTETTKINPGDRQPYDLFGSSVAISSNYATIGAPGSDFGEGLGEGAVYIYYQDDAGKWVRSQKLFSSDKGTYAGMGISVALHKDFVITGAIIEHNDANGQNEQTNAGAAYIFTRATTAQQRTTPKTTRRTQ